MVHPQRNSKLSLSILLIILISLLIGTTAQAQNFVSGRVVDANGNPVPGATVLVRGNNVFTFTDADSAGNWRFNALPSGTLQFYAAANGYTAWPEPRLMSTFGNTSILLTLDTASNVVAGGDFEAQYTSLYWQQPNGGLVYTPDAFDGNTAARLGEATATSLTCIQNNAAGELWTLRQPVQVPNISTPGLSFLYKISTSQSSFDYAWFEVVLIDAAGQPYYLTPWGQEWQARDWSVMSFNLSQWRGQTVNLLFQVAHCSSQSLSATVDRVSIGNLPGAPYPPPNVIPTPVGGNPSPTPSPGVTPPPPSSGVADFSVSSRRLTACENGGQHHLFVRLRDANNQAIEGVRVKFRWNGGEQIVTTGGKIQDLGLAEFPMFKGDYWVSLPDYSTAEVGPFSPDIPVSEVCDSTGQVGNSLYHYSYEIIFTRDGAEATPTPTPISGTPGNFYQVSDVRRDVNEAITQIRGKIVDRNGNPVDGLRIQVRAGNFCTVSVPSGTPGVYPAGEYDVLLRNYASDATWNVAIVDRPTNPQSNTCDASAQLLSPEVSVDSTNREGVVYVDFRGQ